MATDTAVPFWDEANTITCHAEAAVTGKRFVTISGPRVDGNPQVSHAAGTATTKAIGVAAYTVAAGAKVSVYTAPGLVMPVTVAGAITAGDDVYSDADGKATATVTGLMVGIALDDAADGTDAPIKLV